MSRGSAWLVWLSRCWACVAGVATLLAGGERALASQCHVAERPEWAAFEFLDVGPGAKPLDLSSVLLASEQAGRLGPQPCSGHSQGQVSSLVSLEVCPLGSFVKIPASGPLWCGGSSPSHRFDPRSPTSRLERPPRPS